MIENNFKILSPKEVLIVDDIQQILKWRGKYELPNNPEEEIPETLIRSQDKSEIDNIYSNILSETNRFIEMNESYYFEWSDNIKRKNK